MEISQDSSYKPGKSAGRAKSIEAEDQACVQV